MKKSSKQLSVLFATAILLANTTVSPLVQAKESSSTSSETSVTTTSGSSSVASTTQSQSSKRASESSASGMSEASGNRQKLQVVKNELILRKLLRLLI